MIKILLSGCNGKMGQVITRKAEKYDDLAIIAGYDMADAGRNPYPVFTDLERCTIMPDVLVDFSNPAALETLLAFAVTRKIPAVIATTGLSQVQTRLLGKATESIPVFYSANMSLGINLLIGLVKKSCQAIAGRFRHRDS